MQKICTRLFVTDIVKPDSPSARICLTRPPSNRIKEIFNRRIAFLPPKNHSTHTADTNWERIVAAAAPCTPISSTKIKTGSSIRFKKAPITTVSIPVFANP